MIVALFLFVMTRKGFSFCSYFYFNTFDCVKLLKRSILMNDSFKEHKYFC